MLFFQLLKVLKSNIIVKYVKIANAILVRQSTFMILSASNVLVQLPPCKSENHIMLLWHSEVYMIPSRDKYLQSTFGPESLAFPFAVCEYTY
jgi:hypothetical protein